MNRPICLAVVLVWTAAAVAQPRPDPKMDLERFQGRWYYNRVQEGGAELELKGETILVVTGDKLSIEKDGAVLAAGTISVEPAAKPRAFDLKLGGATGKVRKGIYNFDGATLQICLGPPGGERPSGFQTSSGDGWSSITLKKAEQKK